VTAAAALVTAMLTAVNGWLSPASPPDIDRAEVFRAVDDAVGRVEQHVSPSQPRFLAARGTPFGPYFNSAAAVYLWGYSVVTWEYPTLTASDAGRIPDGTVATIMSDNAEEGARFNRLATPLGLRGEVLAIEQVPTARGTFYLTFIRTHAIPEDGLPAQALH
jgi:hypothetical protein